MTAFVSTVSAAEIRLVFNNVFKMVPGFSSSPFLGTISLEVLAVYSVCAAHFVSTISAAEIRRVFNNMFKRS